MAKAPKLTPKQAKFVKGVAQGKPGTIAALEAYDTDNYNTASTIAVENMQKPSVKEAIDKEMEKQGLTLEKIIAPVTKALDSTIKVKTQDGEIIDTGQADLEMQLKGHDRAVKLMSFGQKREDAGGNTFNFTQINNELKNKYE